MPSRCVCVFWEGLGTAGWMVLLFLFLFLFSLLFLEIETEEEGKERPCEEDEFNIECAKF